MSNLFGELEAKFGNIEAKIETKKVHINHVYNDQKELLNQNFNEENLTDKHSNGLNNHR